MSQVFVPVPRATVYVSRATWLIVVLIKVDPLITKAGLTMMVMTNVAVSPSESVTVTVSGKLPAVGGVVRMSWPLELMLAKALVLESWKVRLPVPLSTVNAAKVLEVSIVVAY